MKIRRDPETTKPCSLKQKILVCGTKKIISVGVNKILLLQQKSIFQHDVTKILISVYRFAFID